MFTSEMLKDQIALITGGSRGIGRATCLALAKHGAKVYFFYHKNLEAAHALEAEAKNQGLIIKAIQTDVADRNQVAEQIEMIINQENQIDILINNSGIVRDHLMMALSEDDIRQVLDTNVMGVFNVSQAVIPHMVSRRKGKIINLSSVSGEKGGRGQANYAASKGAINAMTKALAVELASRKITVNAVAPGVIETDISKEVRDLASDEILSKILLKRFGKPEEVANAILFLASPMADYITGEILHVDGGFKMA